MALANKTFKHSSTTYRPENALMMARIAQAVYLELEDDSPDEKAILAQLKKYDKKFKEVIGFNRKSSQGAVIVNSNYITAAFRGTDEPADWLDNLNVAAMDGPIGRVHSGFQRGLMEIWPEMKSAIRKARQEVGKALPLWITGHSLGGAMATLAAAELIQADDPFYGLYTFGSPRAGDREFARTFNIEAIKRTFRFQNNNDIVTRVPARVMGYSHIGSFIYITEGKKLTLDAGFWFQFLDQVSGAVNALAEKGFDGVEDHAVDGYISAILDYGDTLPKG